MVDTISTVVASSGDAIIGDKTFWSINIWTIIAVAELLVLIILLVRNNNRHFFDAKGITEREQSGKNEIDFDNILNSAFHSNEIYEQLKKKCHPDRFEPDEKKVAIAQEIFQLAGKNKHDIKTLMLLKKRAEDELNINF